MLKVKDRLNFCNGFIILKSSDRFAINNLASEIYPLLSDFSKCLNRMSVETKKKKYITIFRSSFVHKKSKETFLFSEHSIRIKFTIKNLTVLNILLNKLENYNKNVDSSIKFKFVDQKTDEEKNIKSNMHGVIFNNSNSLIKFGSNKFKKCIDNNI